MIKRLYKPTTRNKTDRAEIRKFVAEIFSHLDQVIDHGSSKEFTRWIMAGIIEKINGKFTRFNA